MSIEYFDESDFVQEPDEMERDMDDLMDESQYSLPRKPVLGPEEEDFDQLLKGGRSTDQNH